mmetsp:Transcript_37067/g.64990  ORF Transcript_37067/g.64990 Transcript_37067/m.64990 type:complete len:556 (-) Transcript_37067:298-1965(-)|eukprot:CAMPEP_0201899730 /NCGR_PEP_ID=MMETSP0902-20130614/50992_1 /ASSEMBLY_ACC=CAM_ASM_000551 /TAXON_ID=420261 /ORGANISM="Thalassiosira antarctica, Strain CCMP982" /LENGTH=555 /DNA_ID=CAMNT_0048433215 /DNA_START=64 /DNA_END=1731 /DNA_ORIENTATION=+
MPSNKKKKNKDAADKCHRNTIDLTREWSTKHLAAQSKTLLDKLQAPCRLPPEVTRDIVRKLVVLAGTNTETNDNDPYGDGDQSLVGVGKEHDSSNMKKLMEEEPARQILRELFGIGGDLESHLLQNGLSPFAMMCCSGNAAVVEKAIKQTAKGSKERMQLLERRETGMRLTPLLLAIAMSKHKRFASRATGVKEADVDHVNVVKILLHYGARPDCKELTGKSAAHYGAGSMANRDSLKMTDYIFEAAKSSAHFGERVILRNLNKNEYNGLEGTLGGFVAETGRRQVILDESKKDLALLPKNIFSFGDGEEEVCIHDASRNLLNDHDRFGTLSLHEVFLSERIDVAEFLIKRNVSLDIAPVCGNTVRKMVFTPAPSGPSRVNQCIRKYARKMEKMQHKRCDGCNEIFEMLRQCNRCKRSFYCTRECQLNHWRTHKAECQVLDEEYSIQLCRPNHSSLQFASSCKGVSFERPSGVNVDERFWIKVQCLTESDEHLVYDKSRSCSFSIMPGTPGHLELLKKVQYCKAFDGRKLYFKASFDASGNCNVYPNVCSTTRKW